ncbi:hypothetical protein FA95DRAFT_1034289 [Auriscalpium vulgare]|uniref:Uncharacterized protein n=1 Tax=Auriscalpium vulgare TaxID=40419 RepID=A0ACB8RYD8_9AGAM|nr:hypothetical protein FA95DRAFT_1034289 [Auriscalpium vulgare]
MGKSRKRPRVEARPTAPTTVSVDDPDRIDGFDLYQDEVDITVTTLTYLAQHPEALKSKALKGLRTALYDVHRVHSAASGAGTSLTSRISSALIDGRFVDCLVHLAELRIRNQKPKLGALQRWVRECDAASIGKAQGEIVWDVLEAILRTTTDTPPTPPSSSSSSSPRPAVSSGGSVSPVMPHEPWLGGTLDGARIWQQVEAGTLVTPSEKSRVLDTFKPLQVTPGLQRRPPNMFPATIYFSPSASIPLATRLANKVERLEVPNVPGAFMLTNVLGVNECVELIKMAEGVGMVADQPIAGSAAGMVSILAHNVIWLADTTFIDTFYARMVPLLNPRVAGGAVRGINARFRIYRYRPGSIYRPHIDGAWPKSALGTSPTGTPTYIYDSDPTLYSRYTLLIYLNDDFSGGCTTYFTPSTSGTGLDAWPVRPVAGAALVFPHGATEGSLLHEGSPVTDGAKYVIRTEVLYEVERGERGVEVE